MIRTARHVAVLMVLAGSAAAQAPIAPPEDPVAHSPAQILITGFKSLSDMIAVLDRQATNVVVMVDGTPVTDGDIADELRGYPASFGYMPMADAYKVALENVLRQRALALRAKRAGIGKDPTTQRRMAAAADRALVAEYLRHEIDPKITDQALRARYEKQVAGKPGPLETHIRIIMASSRDEALDYSTRLKLGRDFVDLAREVSKDASAASGGDIGFTPLDTLDPAVGAVAFSLNPGEVSANPVKGARGWYIVRNDGMRQQSSPSFEASREQLRREMVNEEIAVLRASMPADIKALPGKIPTIEQPRPK